MVYLQQEKSVLYLRKLIRCVSMHWLFSLVLYLSEYRHILPVFVNILLQGKGVRKIFFSCQRAIKSGSWICYIKGDISVVLLSFYFIVKLNLHFIYSLFIS